MIGEMKEVEAALMEVCKFMWQTCQLQFLHSIGGIIMTCQILGLGMQKLHILIGHLARLDKIM